MNTSLAVTISPPWRHINGTSLRNPNKDIFLTDENQIKSILSYNRIKSYIIYPELDEKGRLHYHGVLNLNSNEYVRFHKHAIWKFRRIGFVDIKPMKLFNDKLKWVIYMSKNWGTTRDILEISKPIIFQDIIKKNGGLSGLEDKSILKNVQNKNTFQDFFG